MQVKFPITYQDKIALIWPGSPCVDASHPAKIQALLKQRYELTAVFAGEPTTCLPAEQRAQQFKQDLFDDNIKMLMALRGGEGCADIIPYLHKNFDKIKNLDPKILIGFSDITALLVYFAQTYNWQVIHGASPLQFLRKDVNSDTEQLTMDLLLGKKRELIYTDFTALNTSAKQTQQINAQLTGGCLSILNISIKDIWEIDTQNKILFVEDVGEAPFSVLRTLKYFVRIGKLQNVKTIIFGDFNYRRISDKQAEPTAHQQQMMKVLQSFAEHNSEIPMLHTKLFGHGKYNFPLIYNKNYILELGACPMLKLSI